MEKEMNALFDQLEAKLATAAPALKPIYQVEGTAKITMAIMSQATAAGLTR